MPSKVRAAMRAAARTTLEALERVSSGGREDRLTEMFAHVLMTVPELAVWLISFVKAAPLPAPDCQLKVFTQGALAGQGRPDLHTYYQDESGVSRLLLSEHKLGAELTDYQRAGYPGWVKRDGLLLIRLGPRQVQTRCSGVRRVPQLASRRGGD